jgi:flagellar biosynthesis/type III secretory pathway chaperone
MDAIREASDELCQKLARSLELVSTLTELSREKETYLTAGDIENLRTATEKEEELIAELGKLERDRGICAGALSEAIGFSGKGLSLSALAEGIPEAALRRQLNTLKDALKNAVDALTAQNEKLRELLALQIDYTKYMLNLIYIPRSKSHTYDVQGSRTDGGGALSFVDLHV